MANSTQINGVPAEVWNETKVPLLIGTCVFLTILTLATIILRFYARLYARADLWWDDWFALATVVRIPKKCGLWASTMMG